MAVAVKTSPGARPTGLPGSVALISLIGVVYFVACLAIVFKLLPDLWWRVWQGIGLGSYQFLGGTLLALIAVAAVVGLLRLGVRLLGPNPPVGVRAGVFVGFLGLLVVLLLTRWASLWYEYYAFAEQKWSPTTGAILAGVTGGLFLAVWLRLFTRPWTQRSIVRLEEAGWFHATWYKSNQGRMVRQGTIIGILLLAGAGVYSLDSQGTLKRGSPDWALNIPFTGSIAIDSFGDAQRFLVEEIPAGRKTRVQVRWPGAKSLGLKGEDLLTVEQYKEKVKDVLNDQTLDVPASVKQKLEAANERDSIEYLVAVNQAIHDRIEQLLAGPTFTTDARKRIREVDNRTDWADLTELLKQVRSEAEQAKRLDELGWLTQMPTAVPVVDRYDLQKANEKTSTSQNVRVGIRLNPSFKYREGTVVSTADFNAEEVRVYTEIARRELEDSPAGKKVLEKLASESSDGAAFRQNLDEEISAAANPALRRRLENVRTALRPDEDARTSKSVPPIIPERLALTPASGTPRFADVTLLPAVRYTIPLLLLGVAVWLAWRVVNMPAFADFLIATEAEMNKVSWTTQKRLIQDTIVVLVTVIVMSLFLFGTDVFWKQVLSWKHIGVLHIPEDKGEKQKLEEKKW